MSTTTTVTPAVGTNLGEILNSAQAEKEKTESKKAFAFLAPDEIAAKVKAAKEKEDARSRKNVEQKLHKERVAQEIAPEVQKLKTYLTQTMSAFGVKETKDVPDEEVKANLRQAERELQKLEKNLKGTAEGGRVDFRALNEVLQGVFWILFHKEEEKDGKTVSVPNEISVEQYREVITGFGRVIEIAVENDNFRELPWTGQANGKAVYVCFDQRALPVVSEGTEMVDLKVAKRGHETITGVGENSDTRYWAWRFSSGSKVVGFMRTAKMCRQALYAAAKKLREARVIALEEAKKNANLNPQGLRESVPGRYVISYSKWGVGKEGERKEVKTSIDVTLSKDGVITFNDCGPGFGRYRGTNPALEDLLADGKFFKFLLLAEEELTGKPVELKRAQRERF